MRIATCIAACWGSARRFPHAVALRIFPRREEDELRDALRTVLALRCALQAARSEVRATDAVRDAHLLAERQLRDAMHQIAIPALRRCDNGTRGHVTDALRGLDEAIPEPVNEASIREAIWSADGWL